jgi:hypothetical protein
MPATTKNERNSNKEKKKRIPPLRKKIARLGTQKQCKEESCLVGKILTFVWKVKM